jgi:hypothetical protein
MMTWKYPAAAASNGWVEEGCNVFSAILTDSTWTGPDGIRFRDPQQVESYCQKASPDACERVA